MKSSYQVGVYDSSSPYEAFKTSKYDTYQKIWQRIQKEGSIVQSTDEALKLVRERKEFVFIDDGPILRHAANKPPCDLKTGRLFIYLFIYLFITFTIRCTT